MIFNNNKEEDQDNIDYFDSTGPEEQEKEPKKPTYHPEDPDYWEEEESEWEHLKPRTRIPYFWLWIITGFVVIGLMIACWLRFLSPYIDEATQYGYVEHIEKRGTVFPTYEGVLIPYKELMDTTRIYSRDFVFSVENDKTAAFLKRAQLKAQPVMVTYKKYHATVPWRGASKIIVTQADTVDPSKILPPEFAPKIHRK